MQSQKKAAGSIVSPPHSAQAPSNNQGKLDRPYRSSLALATKQDAQGIAPDHFTSTLNSMSSRLEE